MNPDEASSDSRIAPSEIRSFAVFFALLLLVYGAWLVAIWPGVIGNDGLAILLHVENPATFNSTKPTLWYRYVQLLYQHLHLAELPIGIIMIMSAFIMARILGWCWSQRMFRTTVFLLIFICASPHLIYFIGTLNPDGFFSVAVAGLLFEAWLLSRQRKANFLSLLNLAIAFPFSLFLRANGIVFLIPAAALVFMVGHRASRLWIGAMIAGWCSLMALLSHYDQRPTHEALFPLALYETVNFLQPRPMSSWFDRTPRVSPSTVEAMTRSHPMEIYLSHYDPDCWDMLNFDPTGPLAMALPQPDRDIIKKEFFRYNLWHNFPKFMGSRVNIFLVATFAQGEFPELAYSRIILPKLHSQSVYRKFDLKRAERLFNEIHEFYYKYRWLLWTPLFGMGLMFWTLRIGIRERNAVFLLVSVPMLIQVTGIFVFSIAGEYRYLLHFFTLPLALLPLIVAHKRREPSPS